jgi:nucleotide-binding universal stress UspA family protein
MLLIRPPRETDRRDQAPAAAAPDERANGGGGAAREGASADGASPAVARVELDRVVIGIDFSDSSLAAARWTAAHLARDAQLALVHAIHLAEPPSFVRGWLPAPEDVVELARRGAEQRLRETGASLATEPVRVEVAIGRPADEIADAARRFGADLIVVGRHGERPAPRWSTGSTAEQLVRSSHVPVLLASDEMERPPARILAAVDESALTGRVLGWARTLADRFGAELVVVHVIGSAVPSHVLAPASLAWSTGGLVDETGTREELGGEASRWIERIAADGFDRARVTPEVAFGDPATEILAAAARTVSDLIVIGSRGAGRVRRALLGSVATAVLRGARQPVLVVREPGEQRAVE